MLYIVYAVYKGNVYIIYIIRTLYTRRVSQEYRYIFKGPQFLPRQFLFLIVNLSVCTSRGCKLHYAQSVCGRGCIAQRRSPDHPRPNRQPDLYYPFLSLLVDKIDTNKPRTRTTYCNCSTPWVIPTLISDITDQNPVLLRREIIRDRSY